MSSRIARMRKDEDCSHTVLAAVSTNGSEPIGRSSGDRCYGPVAVDPVKKSPSTLAGASTPSRVITVRRLLREEKQGCSAQALLRRAVYLRVCGVPDAALA